MAENDALALTTTLAQCFAGILLTAKSKLALKYLKSSLLSYQRCLYKGLE